MFVMIFYLLSAVYIKSSQGKVNNIFCCLVLPAAGKHLPGQVPHWLGQLGALRSLRQDHHLGVLQDYSGTGYCRTEQLLVPHWLRQLGALGSLRQDHHWGLLQDYSDTGYCRTEQLLVPHWLIQVRALRPFTWIIIGQYCKTTQVLYCTQVLAIAGLHNCWSLKAQTTRGSQIPSPHCKDKMLKI